MDMLVSSALEAGSSLPSFFEMFMTQQVELSLKPAARHAHMALAARWPRFHRLSRWFDEVYLVILLLVEAHFLSRHSCLLAESFYGLRRCRYGANVGPSGSGPKAHEDAHVAFELNGAGYGPGQSLRARDRRKALLTVAILPYVLAKLDGGHERSVASRAFGGPRGTRADSTDRGSSSDEGRGVFGGPRRASRRTSAASGMRQRLRRRLADLRSVFFQVYPLLRASYEGSILVYQWLYLFRRSAFFSPTLRLTGMVVRRTTYEDLEEDAAAAALGALGPEGFSGGSVEGAAAPQEEVGVAAGEISGDVGDSGGGPQGLQDRLGQYGRILLVVAIIGFKVAEWWTRVDAQEGPSWRRARLPPPPPPPRPPTPAPGGCGVPADAGACPVCGGARVNPALCAVSGFVFCYRCIVRHVEEHGECPVTGLACSEGGIVRLYDDE